MVAVPINYVLLFFNDTATTEIYTLSLHDALPIWPAAWQNPHPHGARTASAGSPTPSRSPWCRRPSHSQRIHRSEEHTLNSSHANISYAVFCLKKKNTFKSLALFQNSSHSPLATMA